MGEWTNLKINDGYECRLNLTRTHVTISTIYGEYTDSVESIREKLRSNHLLVDVRKMFQAMLDYYENSVSV